MTEKEVTIEEIIKLVGTKQDKFTTFLSKMPEQLGREECSFSEERRVAMFKSADADGDGNLSADEFKAILHSVTGVLVESRLLMDMISVRARHYANWSRVMLWRAWASRKQQRRTKCLV